MMMMQKITSVAATLAFLTAHAQAQVTYDFKINSYRCPTRGGNYCLGPSLDSTIIVRCKEYIGIWRNCKFQNLTSLPPRGAKEDALCYQPDLAVANASCVWNGTVYPDDRAPFPFQNRSTTVIPSATSKAGLNVSSVTLEAASSTDINGPSQPLRNCTDSESFPEFPLEGICNFFPSSTAPIPLTTSSTSSTSPTPRITLEAKDGQDISGPSPLRDCIGIENSPAYELEGICNFVPTLTASIPLTTSSTSSTASIPRTTSEAPDGQDISGPSPLRDCIGIENTPAYELEGICNFVPTLTASIPLTTSSTRSTISIPQASNSTALIPRATLKSGASPDINGPSQPLRDCIGSENSLDYELEGICHVTTSPKTSIPQATSSRTPIPQTTLKVLKELKVEVSPDINGPSQPLRDCTDSENFLEYELEGICHVTSATHGNKKSSKAKREPAATTVALFEGSANMRAVGMSIIAAELLALTLIFLLAN